MPVIIMGETGCGKTKLIEFMSNLQTPTQLRDQLTTMVVVKVGEAGVVNCSLLETGCERNSA